MSVEQEDQPGLFPGEKINVSGTVSPESVTFGVIGGQPEAEEVRPAQAMPPRDEHERLDPEPLPLRLVSGLEFDLEPLKLRQFLRLLRIVTRGAADVLDQSQLDFENPDQFVQTFLGMVLFSIPEAEEETVEFLKSMVRPKGLTGNPDKDIILVRELSTALDNPDLEDTVTIVQSVIERESEDLRSLGKRLGSMLKVAEKMGATSPTPSTGN